MYLRWQWRCWRRIAPAAAAARQQHRSSSSNIAATAATATATMPIKEQKGENKSRTLVSTCVSVAPLWVFSFSAGFATGQRHSVGGAAWGAENPAHLQWKPHSNNLATNEQLILK